jgi:TonB family protein
MIAHFFSTDRPRRLGSAVLSLAASGAMLGLMTTLGWQGEATTPGPALTLLSAKEFGADQSSSQLEELHAETANRPIVKDITPPEDTPRATPATSAPAPATESDRPVTNFGSASLIPDDADGAQGIAGRGRETGAAPAAAASASSASTQAASAASGGSGDAYGRAVFSRIKARQSYVHEIARDKIEGTVTLSFIVDPRGRLRSERVAASSGHQRLDRIALDQLREAAPFAAPPKHQARAFSIRLTYRPTTF